MTQTPYQEGGRRVQSAYAEQREVNVSLAVQVGTRAARAAGAYLLERHGAAHVVGQKSVRDDVLDVDVGAERIIVDQLRAAMPGCGVLSEELGAVVAGEGPCESQWIVDPLDGSANYQHASPLYGVAVCLRSDGATQMSLVYLPAAKEFYCAVCGEGARCNKREIKVSTIHRLDAAMVHVGDFSKTGSHEVNRERLALVGQLADAVGRVRLLGSAAVDWTAVASGRAEGLVMADRHPWDTEAGMLLVQEAGGCVSRYTATSGGRYVVAGNPLIHDELVALVARALG